MSSFIRTSKPRTGTWQNFRTLGRLLFLYDANDADRFYASGDSVSTLFDLSGNNFHMTQSGAARPTFTKNDDGNGNACLNFDGATKYMVCADNDELDRLLIQGNTGITWFAVASHNATAGASGEILSKYGVAAGPSFGFYGTGAATCYPWLYCTNSAGSNAYAVRGSTNVNATTSIIVQTYVSTPVMSSILDGVVDASAVTVNNAGNGAFDGNASNFFLGCMNTGSPSQLLNGKVYLVGAFIGLFTAYRRKQLEQMLSVRFQKSITL